MKHRHLDVPPGTPPEDLPSAAIVDLLDRGDLDDWRPVLRALAQDPFGEFSKRVRSLVDAYPMYGTSELVRAWIRHRQDIESGKRSVLHPSRAIPLATVRRRLGFTQAQVAERMGISQSDLSKLERRADLRVSTLQAYARALGVDLGIVVGAPDRSPVPVRLAGRDSPRELED